MSSNTFNFDDDAELGEDDEIIEELKRQINERIEQRKNNPVESESDDDENGYDDNEDW